MCVRTQTNTQSEPKFRDWKYSPIYISLITLRSMAYRNIFSGHGQKMWYSFVVYKVYDANRISRSINDYVH